MSLLCFDLFETRQRIHGTRHRRRLVRLPGPCGFDGRENAEKDVRDVGQCGPFGRPHLTGDPLGPWRLSVVLSRDLAGKLDVVADGHLVMRVVRQTLDQPEELRPGPLSSKEVEQINA